MPATAQTIIHIFDVSPFCLLWLKFSFYRCISLTVLLPRKERAYKEIILRYVHILSIQDTCSVSINEDMLKTAYNVHFFSFGFTRKPSSYITRI